MKYIKFIIAAAFLSTAFSGCSYVSDYAEGRITNRASFGVTAEYNSSTNEVDLTWEDTDGGVDFAGVEIYITTEANDEYAGYTRIASRYDTPGGSLGNGSISRYSAAAPSVPGIYFYRVGFIHWDQSPADRTLENGYIPKWPDSGWDNEAPNYNFHTKIDAISGYGRVVIPQP